MFVNMRKDYGSTRRAYLALLPLPNLHSSITQRHLAHQTHFAHTLTLVISIITQFDC